MKEELYKYLSIGLLALLLLVCFGSLITYFVVGQESINTAYAAYSSASVVNDNLLDGYFLDGHELVVSNSLQNGQWFASSGVTVTSSSSGLNISAPGNSYLMYTIPVPSSSSVTVAVHVSSGVSSSIGLYDYNFSVGDSYNALGSCSSVTSRVYYFVSTKGSNISGYSSFGLSFNAPVSCKVSYIKCESGQYFTGQPRNSYLPNGYDQGYTDGVNSASGGDDLSGITDLTDVTWRAPSTVTTEYTGSSSLFYINGTLNGSNGSYSFTNLGITFSDVFTSEDSAIYLGTTDIYSDLSVPVVEGDIIIFSGGDDATNSALIDWLQSNSPYLTYTDGYQDGYNKGHDIGYDEGYSQGNTDTIVTLDTYLQAFGSSTFTGVINQDPTTFWWSVQPGMQPNTAVYGYLYFNISSLPIGSIVHFNFPFQKYIVKDNSNVEHEITDIRVLYDVDYYTNLLIAPRDSLPSIRLQQGVGTYSFNVIRPGDTIVLYFPLNMVTDFNRYTFGLSWEGDEYNYSFTTSSISLDIKTQLDNAYERGLKDGNSQGYSSGYTVGYNEGADGAEHYTFNNLLGAVFDAPITMFLGKYNSQTGMREGGLFNFELLGVNLSGFVIALLSIGVVLFIMRLFLRGL